MERDNNGNIKVHLCILKCFDEYGSCQKILRKGSISEFEVLTWAEYEGKVWECLAEGNRCEKMIECKWVTGKAVGDSIREFEKCDQGVK